MIYNKRFTYTDSHDFDVAFKDNETEKIYDVNDWNEIVDLLNDIEKAYRQERIKNDKLIDILEQQNMEIGKLAALATSSIELYNKMSLER